MAETRTIKVDDPVYRRELLVLHGMIAAKEAIEEIDIENTGTALAYLAVEKAIGRQQLRLYMLGVRHVVRSDVPFDRVVSIQCRTPDEIELEVAGDDLFDTAPSANAKGEPNPIPSCPDPPAPER